MKLFKFLPVTYRITIIILLALYAEHIAACNWLKFNSKPFGHNINHKVIKSSNPGTQRHILNPKSVQNHAAKTLNVIKQANQTHTLNQKIAKNHTEQRVNVSNQEPKCNCKYDVASKANALNLTIHVQKGKNLTSHSLAKPEVEKISSVVNQGHKCNCKQSVGANANSLKLIREALDKMAKTNNQATTQIHSIQDTNKQDAAVKEKTWKLIFDALKEMSKIKNEITSHVGPAQESNKQDAVAKEKTWKLIREALDKMTRTNNPVTSNIEMKQESKCNCKHNDDATKENALQHETKFNCKHETDLKSLISTIKEAIQRVENTLYVSKQVSKLSCNHYDDIKKYALLSFNNALNSLH